MNITTIPSQNFHPTNWSGGTTTELFIFPLSANYKQFDFDFRLSTATVEVDSSIFTPLSGVSRTLMVLEGNMTLTHQDHHTKHLSNLMVDKFDGGWNTNSVGQCIDFNLMTRGTTKGDVIAFTVNKNKTNQMTLNQEGRYLFIYLYFGTTDIGLGNKSNTLQKGDLLVIEKPEISGIKIEGIEDSVVVFTFID